MNGLSVVNIELTSRCGKSCWMCGRRRLEKEHPELCNFGDMDRDLMFKILKQIPSGIVVQYHNSGDPLCYPYLYQALTFRDDYIRCFNTNAKLLLEKAGAIINNMESLTISVIENDPEGDEQFQIVKEFLKIKGDRKPFLVYRLLGDVSYLEEKYKYPNFNDIKRKERWYELPGIVATRILHNPMGSFDYEKKVTIPEIGICQDMLHHLVINRLGKVSCCVRYDINNELVIGDVKTTSLADIWNGEKRKEFLDKHINGKRNEIPFCSKCWYWGVPRCSE